MFDRHYRDAWQRHDDGQEPPPAEPETLTLEDRLSIAGWMDLDWKDVVPPAGKPYATATAAFLASYGRVRYVKLSDGRVVQHVGFVDDTYSVPDGF